MSGVSVLNRARPGFYLDSVALMRYSQAVAALPGVETATMMIGSESNKGIMEAAGLLADEGRGAEPNDLIIAVRAESTETGEAALTEAEALLDRPAIAGDEAGAWHPKSLETALEALAGANLALISIPGEFAAGEARKALAKGLHVMIFSDNVTIEDERALKEEARRRGLLVMGPDCGTAIIGGVPLAFANEVPRGAIGLVSASGTGLQEVSCLIARGGKGVSHGIGVGGRDLGDKVGGLMTLMAIDALDVDARTKHIVLISKPPSDAVAKTVLARIAESPKTFTICFLGLESFNLPDNAAMATTLEAAAADALGNPLSELSPDEEAKTAELAKGMDEGRRWIRALFAGGTMCAETQVIFRVAGQNVLSNVPIPGALPLGDAISGHSAIDLGADEYTVGRPHPMIEPAVRNDVLEVALAEPDAAVILLDMVIGHGAHADPVGDLADVLKGAKSGGPVIIASVTGTEDDPQVYSEQIVKLRKAGVMVAPSNARATALALAVAGHLE